MDLQADNQTDESGSDQTESIFFKDAIYNKFDTYVPLPHSILCCTDLSPTSKLVWSAIADRCGKGKYFSYAGINRIANDTNLSRNTVIHCLAELKENGYLFEEKKQKGHAPHRFPMVKV